MTPIKQRHDSQCVCSSHLGLLFLLAALLPGCGQKNSNKPIYGSITVDDEQQPTSGRVIFTPIEGHLAPPSHTQIVDGRYRIDARGGVSPGIYRVLVEGQCKTGRQTTVTQRGEVTKTDEQRSVVPAIYASPDSPLVVTVSPDSDGHIDLHIPTVSN